jgi:hypothetical protein
MGVSPVNGNATKWYSRKWGTNVTGGAMYVTSSDFQLFTKPPTVAMGVVEILWRFS